MAVPIFTLKLYRSTKILNIRSRRLQLLPDLSPAGEAGSDSKKSRACALQTLKHRPTEEVGGAVTIRVPSPRPAA